MERFDYWKLVMEVTGGSRVRSGIAVGDWWGYAIVETRFSSLSDRIAFLVYCNICNCPALS